MENQEQLKPTASFNELLGYLQLNHAFFYTLIDLFTYSTLFKVCLTKFLPKMGDGWSFSQVYVAEHLL